MDADTIQSWCTSLVLRLGLFGLSFVAVAVTACRGPTDSTSGPDLLQVASGNSQSGTVNRQLAQRLSVKVTTSDGMPRADIGITWSVTAAL